MRFGRLSIEALELPQFSFNLVWQESVFVDQSRIEVKIDDDDDRKYDDDDDDDDDDDVDSDLENPYKDMLGDDTNIGCG
ncbi:hypothetical protein U1Q18_003462 [Sarracenia purpurea var. burkii]